MRRIILFALFCLIGVCHLMANPVTVSQAREKASQFLNKRVAKRARAKAPSAKSLKMMSAGKNDSYYIFNVDEEGGYVVVSGDDATEEILGYSDTGSIDPETMPCNMRALLDTYAEQIKYIRDNGITREQNLAANTKSSKSFHLSDTLARFDQGEPYNRECIFNGLECATGCVATAMAQLMFYHSWPEKTTSTIPGYVSKKTDAKSGITYEFQIDEIPSGTAIDWGHIQPEYVSDANEESKNAVAHLMKLAGASVKMEYGKSSSTATAFVAFALKQYFGYASADVRLSSSYNYFKWVNMLRQELENNGPIVYKGDTHDQGTNYDDSHAFLLEGYEDDYFDMNFGWSGLENGRFLLNAIVLEDGITHFGENQYAIMNVVRQSLLSPNDALILRTDDIKVNDKDIYYRSAGSSMFENINLWFKVVNATPIDAVFYNGFLFKNVNGEEVDNYYSEDLLDINSNIVKTYPNFIISAKNLIDGKYTIQAICKEVNSDTWQINDNSDEEYINAVVCGDKLSLQYTEPVATVSLVDFIQTSEAPLRVGQQSDFIVTVKNAYSSEDYKGGILIKDAESDKVIHIDEVDLVGDNQGQISFSYTPTTDGEHYLQVLNKSWDEIGGLITFAYAADASLDLLEVTNMELVDGDMSRLLIDGTYLRARMSVRNKDVVKKTTDVTITLTNVETQVKKTKTIAVNIEPNSTQSYSFGFGNLVAGNHYTVIASYPNKMDFYTSPQLLCTTEGMGEVEPGNESLVQYEYWFDDGFANRQVVGMNSNSAVVRASIDTEGLEYGAHRFNFRVKRSDNMYSAVTSSMFLKLSADKATTLECWLDDDRENIIPIEGHLASDGIDYLFDSDLDLGAVTPGHHRLYCRVVSNSGKTASAVTMTPIIVKSRYNVSSADAKVTQYSISVDDEEPVKVKISNPSNDITMERNLDVQDLTPGKHTVKARFWNSLGLAVGDETQFTVTAPVTPTIALTATEADGTVQLHFDVPTSVHRYALARRDANGAKAVIYKETQNETGGGLFTDSPSAGSYTYFVQGSYRDAAGTSHLVNSNEVPVSVAQAQAPTEYGYITGIIWPKFGAATMHDIVYSDGVETTITDKYFERQQIPVGTTLTISVRGNSLEEFETATVTIKKGENSVSLKDITQVEESTPNLNNNDLQFGSDLEWVGNNYQFMVKNITRNAWSGKVRLRIITKENALLEKQKEKEEGSGEVVIPEPTTQVGTGTVAPFQLRGEDNYVYVYSDNISLSKDQSTMVSLSLDNVFAPDKKDWYYIYVESVGKWDSDPKDMVKVKPIGIDRDFNVTENPILRQVDKSLLAKAQEKVLLQDAEHAANVILLICSKLNQFNGLIGDFEQFGRDLAEKGKKMKDIDMAKLNRYVENALETETADELANDEMVQALVNAVLGNSALVLVEEFRENIANDIFKGSKVVSQYLGNAIKVLKHVRDFREWEKMNDYDKFFYCADAILDAADKYPGNPMCSILKTYSKVAKSFIQKALEYGETYYKMQEVDLLFENIPSEKDKPRYDYNRHVDFKIKVRTNRWVFFNFDHFGTSPIRDVTVKVHNRPNDPEAVATIHFDLVPVWDGVMLRQTSMDSGGGLGEGYLDEGYPVDRMWMEIKWKNGRTTKVPLRDDIDGVDFDAASITQNTKQYTVYLQSGTTKFANMADIIEVKE